MSPRTQALIDSYLKATQKKSLFTTSQQKTIQRDKFKNIAMSKFQEASNMPQYTARIPIFKV